VTNLLPNDEFKMTKYSGQLQGAIVTYYG